MVTCWSCHGLRGETAFCPTCGAIQPPRAGQNFFALFGLEPSFDVDVEGILSRYREMQQQFHPDRFATRSATERRFSLEQVTLLNQAHQTLRDPLARAIYLLEWLGQGALMRVGGIPDDPAFLMENMELRENLAEVDIAARGADERLALLRSEMRERIAHEEQTIARAFRRYFTETAVDQLTLVARHANRLRYHRRFMEELERLEEKLFDA